MVPFVRRRSPTAVRIACTLPIPIALTALAMLALSANATNGAATLPATRDFAPRPIVVEYRSHRAVDSLCDYSIAGPLAYHWPVKPFDKQHPIRGYFGDPRTLGEERLGADKRGRPGSFTFHNGIDIVAPTGTPVYPVVSGVAHRGSGDLVSVTTGDGRTFQYFHLKPDVGPGQRVIAYRTVLGHVERRWQHVHLTEIDDFRPHNPLDPGHLEPYRDHTIPTIDQLSFATEQGASLNQHSLHGKVLIAADAEDMPAIPVPGHWLGFPVTPALVTWRLTSASGRVVFRATAADFRHTEPPRRDFWRVYAAGTYQNFPDFFHHFFWHIPGRYLFNLTSTPLNTRRLPDGIYRISVGVADTCGNRGTLTEPVRISNRRTATHKAAHQSLVRRTDKPASSHVTGYDLVRRIALLET